MKAKYNRYVARALCATAFLAAGTLFAENGIAVSATAESAAYAGLADDAGKNGFSSELTLVLESEADDSLSFRAEGGYALTYGIESAVAKSFASGLAAKPDPATLAPGTDLHRVFFLNQAYAAASFDRALVRAGILPVSWGSAYLWNPTSRTAALAFPGENIDETVGKPGAEFSLAIPLPDGAPLSVSIDGYALASGRRNAAIPDMEELDADDVPFGARVQARTDALDASFSAIRELSAPGGKPALFFGADIAFAFGDANCYAEAATEYDRSPVDSSELSAGFSWLIPGIEITARSEYIRLGSGAAKASEYDTEAFLQGDKILLARDYLYAGLEKEDPEAARWKASGGALVNLDDGSVATLAGITLLPVPDLEVSCVLRAFIATSGRDAEFGGKRTLGPDASFAPYGSAVGLTAKWAF